MHQYGTCSAHHEQLWLSRAGNSCYVLQNAAALVQVLAAANVTVANNNDGGIAEAIERFIL